MTRVPSKVTRSICLATLVGLTGDHKFIELVHTDRMKFGWRPSDRKDPDHVQTQSSR